MQGVDEHLVQVAAAFGAHDGQQLGRCRREGRQLRRGRPVAGFAHQGQRAGGQQELLLGRLSGGGEGRDGLAALAGAEQGNAQQLGGRHLTPPAPLSRG